MKNANESQSRQAVFGPRSLLVRAALLTALFGIAHLAGFREYTSVLCGMVPAVGRTAPLAAFCGAVYVVVYLLFTLAVPVMLLAAAMLFAWDRLRTRKWFGRPASPLAGGNQHPEWRPKKACDVQPEQGARAG